MIMSYRRAHCNYFDNSRGKQVNKLAGSVTDPPPLSFTLRSQYTISLFLSENFSLKGFNQQEQNKNILLKKKKKKLIAHNMM